MRGHRILLLVLAMPGIALAQTSVSYKLTESTLNHGGDPKDGVSAASASWHIKLDSIGDGMLGVALSSASWHSDAGFVDVYAPPREVASVRWASKTSVLWDPEPSVGSYDVYRDLLSTLPGNFGVCFASGLTSESATEPASPSLGAPWFYLVTARNRLGEEGTKGFRSSGAERPNPAPCP